MAADIGCARRVPRAQRFGRLAVVASLLPVLAGCPMLLVRGVRHGYAGYVKTVGAEVDASLASWRAHLLAGRHDAAAAVFAPGGQWLRSGTPPLDGPAAILAALQGPGPRLVELEFSGATVDGGGPQAVQAGRYRQVLQLPDGRLQPSSGRFDARWAYDTGGRWRLVRLQQVSADPH